MKITRTKAAWSKRLSAAVLSTAMALTMIPANALVATAAERMKELAGPVIDTEPEDTSLVPVSQQMVTWDCIWFGSYPQREIITTEMSETYTADGNFRIYSEIANIETPYLVADSVYNYLADPGNEEQWENNDITYEGVKYRRMTMEEATLIGARGTVNSKARYHWRNDTEETWHYFIWEPIKWRVLSAADNGELLLLADKGLDDQLYNTESAVVTWETCSLRSWLNDNFLNAAFTDAEQSSIKPTTVTGTTDIKVEVPDTEDKVFILAINEMSNTDYGFMEDITQSDEARCFKNSTYAMAMGATANSAVGIACGNGYCWMRDTQSSTKKACSQNAAGYVNNTTSVLTTTAKLVNSTETGLCPRPAITLDASAPYYYAGTVSSDGTRKEVSYESSKAETLANALLHTEDLTLADEEIVKAAREAYEALPDAEKAGFDYAKLTAAEEKIAGLLQLVADAQNKIDELKDIEDLTLTDKKDVIAAREVYEALPDAEKARIDLTKLTAAEGKITELLKPVTEVQALIDALPATVTLANENAVTAARAAYTALTAEQKEQINLAKLTAAETKLTALKQSNTNQSSSTQTGTSQSGSTQTSTSQSGSAQTNTSQSGAAQTKPVVKLNASKIPLQVKKTTTALKVTTIGKGDKVASWKSSNKKVATVTSKGKIKALKVGKATITVTTKKGAKATCTVTVQKAKVTTKSLKVSTDAKLKLKKGKKATITVTRNPITATEKITYKSSNTKIATVTKKGVVKAKKKGSCKITVKSSNGKKKVVQVTVTN